MTGVKVNTAQGERELKPAQAQHGDEWFWRFTLAPRRNSVKRVTREREGRQ